MCTFNTTSFGTRSVDLLERRDDVADDDEDFVLVDDRFVAGVVAVVAVVGGGVATGCWGSTNVLVMF